MRHNVAGYKLGRSPAHRRALWRNMAIAFFTHKQITTTVPKAKSLKPLVEKIITLAKKGDLASRRRVIQILGDPIFVDFDPWNRDLSEVRADGYTINKWREISDGPRLVKRIFDEIAPAYADRTGGYSRLVRLGTHRLGDGGDLCVLQLVKDGEKVKHSTSSRRRKQADRRTAFAAERRKAAKSEAKAEAASE